MKVIHLLSEKEHGSRFNYALDLCRSLNGFGVGIIVVTRRDSEFCDPFRKAGIEVASLPLGGIFDVVSAPAISRALRRLPDREITLHTQSLRDAATAANARRLADDAGKEISVVLTLHPDEAAIIAGDPDYPAARKGAAVLRDVDRILFTGESSMSAVLKTFPGLDDGKRVVTAVPLSVAPARANLSDSAPGDAPHSTPMILFSGRIMKSKGLDILLDALARITELPWQLTVCGQGKGQDVSPLLLKAVRLGIKSRISWLGSVDDVTPLLASACVCVLPHLSPAPSLSAVEAFSQGVPCVASDTGDLPDIVTDGVDGFITPAGNSKALAEALARLISDPDKRDFMGSNAAKSFSSRFDFHSTLQRIYPSVAPLLS